MSDLGAWQAANRRDLGSRLEWLLGLLRRSTERRDQADQGVEPSAETPVATDTDSAAARPTAFDAIAAAFGLSAFERGVLLLCAGRELDSRIRAICALVNGGERAYVTVGLALAVLPEPDWKALAPTAALRRWRLVELTGGVGVADAALSIDERVLHYLTGTAYLDPRLQSVCLPFAARAEIPSSHTQWMTRIQDAWRAGSERWPVIVLSGSDVDGARDLAARACTELGIRGYCLAATDVPASATERDAFCRLWERDATLQLSALLIDSVDGPLPASARAFIRDVNVPLFVLGTADGVDVPLLHLEIARPTTDEQRQLWRDGLGPLTQRLNGHVDLLLSQCDLGARAIETACSSAHVEVARGAEPAAAVTRACRLVSRAPLDGLAQRIDPVAGWEDLVLSAPQMQILRTIPAQVRRRIQVYHAWGFASRLGRGLGVSALFAGEPGTGKTMAAEVLARDLDLELFRIDVSQLVSKYIGETEKNLRRVFDAAEESGAILLFDEADALFARRTAVNDSHDRYANIEVSYLLQRMEAYRGLAVLTTNMKSALDEAFLRRLRFVVEFPFPDRANRLRIWRQVFPSATPTCNLDYDKLARLRVPGGAIRNIALNAAFLAADCGEPVGMAHLRDAAHVEYAKRDRPLTDAEAGGWT
jgi:ATPase family associated with various cellular activities (AAA)